MICRASLLGEKSPMRIGHQLEGEQVKSTSPTQPLYCPIFTLPCPTLSYPILPYTILPYPILPYPFLPLASSPLLQMLVQAPCLVRGAVGACVRAKQL